MPQLSILSPAEQVAAHLRNGILLETWGKEMPGAPRLSRDLGVDPKTVLAALALLEKQGLLVPQGVGRRRRIELPEGAASGVVRPLRIGILLGDSTGRKVDYLGELQHGIATGPFNLPDWKDDMEGFHALLTRLFRVTPPTALIIQEAFLFSAAYHFLARRGLRVPEDVSLVCTDGDSSFAWSVPAVSHIRWDSRPLVRHVVGWAARVSKGKKDLRQSLTKAAFVEGGTIGPRKS